MTNTAASSGSGSNSYPAKKPVRSTEKSQLHFTSGQRATLKRASSKKR